MHKLPKHGVLPIAWKTKLVRFSGHILWCAIRARKLMPSLIPANLFPTRWCSSVVQKKFKSLRLLVSPFPLLTERNRAQTFCYRTAKNSLSWYRSKKMTLPPKGHARSIYPPYQKWSSMTRWEQLSASFSNCTSSCTIRTIEKKLLKRRTTKKPWCLWWLICPDPIPGTIITFPNQETCASTP